jgi:hypothetical protein
MQRGASTEKEMRIANVVLNDFTRDNRVLKISATLSTEGHDVTVVALHKPGLPKREHHQDSFDVHRICLVMPTRVFRGTLKLVELALKSPWAIADLRLGIATMQKPSLLDCWPRLLGQV